MNLLKNLEKKLENIIEGAFSKSFPTHVQPVEIAKKIDSQLMQNKTVTLARTFAPNHFEIELSEQDYKHLEGFIDSIKKELIDYVYSKAKESDLYATGVQVEIKKNKKIKLGLFDINSNLTQEIKEEVEAESAQKTQIISQEELAQSLKVFQHIIEDSKTKKIYKLDKPSTILGRSKVCDISIDDSSASRKHMELVKEDDQIRLVDLDSTNGTIVNRTTVKAKMLRSGDKIEVGKTLLIYRRRNG